MSGSAQDLEAGIWLRLSGDWEWSRQLFERALATDPGNSTARYLLQSAPTNEISASSAKSELWSRLPISIPRWENPFVRRNDASQAGARPGWELDIPWGGPSMPRAAEEVSVEIDEVMEVEDAEESDRELGRLELRIGPTSSVPSMLLNADQLVDLRLDHRAGFVLSQIDGTLSFEDLFTLCGMSRLDTARILVQLLDQKIISRG
jgi:hypothetical protein